MVVRGTDFQKRLVQTSNGLPVLPERTAILAATSANVLVHNVAVSETRVGHRTSHTHLIRSVLRSPLADLPSQTNSISDVNLV